MLNRLKDNENFTSAENILAEYILKDPSALLTKSMDVLASETYVSKPTIIRFYRKLGYDSYHTFRIALHESHLRSLNEKSVDANHPFKDEDSLRDISQSIVALTKQTVDSCFLLIDEKEINKSVNMLYNAKRIFILALGDCYSYAEVFINKLAKLNLYANMLNKNAYSYVNVFNLTKDDVVLIITSTGKTLKLEKNTIRILTESDTKTILITPSFDLDLRNRFDSILQISNEEHDTLKISSIASQTAILFVLSVIICYMYQHNYKDNHQINERYHVFLKEYVY